MRRTQPLLKLGFLTILLALVGVLPPSASAQERQFCRGTVLENQRTPPATGVISRRLDCRRHKCFTGTGKEVKCKKATRTNTHGERREFCVCQGQNREPEKDCHIVLVHKKKQGVPELHCAGKCPEAEQRCVPNHVKLADGPPVQFRVTCLCLPKELEDE